MRATSNEQFHSWHGAPLYLGTSNSIGSDDVQTWDAADGDAHTEWINLGARGIRGAFELIWTGAFTAEVYIQGSNGGPGQRLSLDETIIGPNAANTFTGDISKAPGSDLEGEDIGVALVNLSGLGMGRARMELANTVGTGSWGVRFHAKGA